MTSGVSSKEKIIWGGDYRFPPYEYLDQEGRVAGFNVALFKAVAETADLTVEFELGQWSEIRRKFLNQEIDVLSMIYSTDRDEEADFSVPHCIVYHSIFSHRSNKHLETIEDLQDSEIVVQKADIMHDYVKNRKLGRKIITVDTPERALSLINDNKYDCALVMQRQGLYFINQKGFEFLRISDQPFFKREYCYAVSKGRTHLLSQINEAMAVVKETGQYKEIYNHWLGILEHERVLPYKLLKYLVSVFVPLIMIILIILGWSWTLKRRVQTRTSQLEQEIKKHQSTSEALQKSEEEYRQIFNHAAGIIMTMDKEGNIVTCNPRIMEVLGYSIEEMIGRNIVSLADHENRKKLHNILACVIDGINVHDNEISLIHKTNKTIPLSISAAGYESPGTNTKFKIIVVMEDINDRLVFTNTIEQINRLLRTIRSINKLISEAQTEAGLITQIAKILTQNQAVMTAWIALIDNEQKIRLFRSSGCSVDQDKIKTYLEDPINPTCFQRLLKSEDILEVFSENQLCVNCPLNRDQTQYYNLLFHLKYGNQYWGMMAVTLPKEFRIESEIKDLIHEIAGDIALGLYNIELKKKHQQSEEEKDKIQQQLFHSQKMEAVGTLAGGVAHDFNNLLTIIQGHAQLAMMDLDPESEMIIELNEIYDATSRASKLTRQLLLLSKKQSIAREPLNLNSIISNLSKMLRRTIGEDIQFDTELNAQLFNILGDESHLEQVILNLVINARDAMPDGGILTIKTNNLSQNSTIFDMIAGMDPDLSYISLTVEDTGVGMDSNIMDHLFEPFFTTKEHGKGTGLGLAVVYGIVKKHNGFIRINSDLAKGTIFEVFFPALAERNNLQKTDPIRTISPMGENEKILLVEDEEKVRNFLLQILQKYGYIVTDTATAEEALQKFENNPDHFDAVFSDVVLPGMSGLDLVHKIREIRPKIAVILGSGYTSDKLDMNALNNYNVEFIQKPYSIHKLLHLIKTIIKNSVNNYD